MSKLWPIKLVHAGRYDAQLSGDNWPIFDIGKGLIESYPTLTDPVAFTAGEKVAAGTIIGYVAVPATTVDEAYADLQKIAACTEPCCAFGKNRQYALGRYYADLPREIRLDVVRRLTMQEQATLLRGTRFLSRWDAENGTYSSLRMFKGNSIVHCREMPDFPPSTLTDEEMDALIDAMPEEGLSGEEFAALVAKGS